MLHKAFSKVAARPVNPPFNPVAHLAGMDPTHIGLFDLAERRLAWADRRQGLLAQNIANANTPGYRPHDLKPFATALAGAGTLGPVRTQPNHLARIAGPGRQMPGREMEETEPRPTARAPDGNAVTLDDQLIKVANTETTHALVTTIYKKYLGLFAMALGRSSSG
jgi:flagellar basal-body rod protein FlgB